MFDHAHSRLEVKFAADEAAPGSFTGYGAVFGNVDGGGDMIQKGAFKKTLKASKTGAIKMLLQHGMGFAAEDEIPIGIWTSIEEDDTGLKVSGQLFGLDTQKGKYIHEGLKAGVLDGLSIGYIARDVSYGSGKDGEPRRTIKAADLYEISIVTFPMNGKARVADAKSAGIKTIREFEAFLRDEGGFSIAQAKAIASGGYKALPSLRDEGRQGETEAETLAFLKALRQ